MNITCTNGNCTGVVHAGVGAGAGGGGGTPWGYVAIGIGIVAMIAIMVAIYFRTREPKHEEEKFDIEFKQYRDKQDELNWIEYPDAYYYRRGQKKPKYYLHDTKVIKMRGWQVQEFELRPNKEHKEDEMLTLIKELEKGDLKQKLAAEKKIREEAKHHTVCFVVRGQITLDIWTRRKVVYYADIRDVEFQRDANGVLLSARMLKLVSFTDLGGGRHIASNLPAYVGENLMSDFKWHRTAKRLSRDNYEMAVRDSIITSPNTASEAALTREQAEGEVKKTAAKKGRGE